MIEIKTLTKSYGDRLLFGDISFTLRDGDKVAVVARNGTGKSTLLRIIAGDETPDSGEIVMSEGLRVAWLPQTPRFDPELTVIEACMGHGSVSTAARTAADYLVALEGGDTEAIHRATAQMDADSAWDYEDRLRRMLTELQITDLGAKVSTLSGGQLKRVALAAVLLDAPDVLILDEPTNHLDIPTIEWLEKRLARERVTLLLVTHDRYFLDRTCSAILELDHRSAFMHKGDFDNYLRRRAERLEAMAADVARARNLLRRETDWMRRQPQARGSKAQYRIDAYHELTQRARAERTQRDLSLQAGKTYIGSKVFEADGVTKHFGDLCVLDGFSYVFARRDKVGIVGPNGVGKSTFVKMLLGQVMPDSGTFDVGETVRFGYYSQDGISFDDSKKVIDAITEHTESVRMPDGSTLSPMQFLTRFNFEPADQQKYIHTLSGGEKARLHLATVLMGNPNFLILDEPTNDLDIMTLGVLGDYLSNYDGCALIVSHDRYFLDSIVDHLFVFAPGGKVSDFPGNYSGWREYDEAQRRDQTRQAEAQSPKAERDKPVERARKLTFKERRELEQLTVDIDTLTAQKAEMDALFASGETIADAAALAERYAAVTTELDDKEMRWLELSEIES